MSDDQFPTPTHATIATSGNVIRIGQLAVDALTRAYRYPVATGVGAGAAVAAHFVTATALPGNTWILTATVIEIYVGTALYLALVALMVFDQRELQHLGRLARIGALISLAVTVTTAIPLTIGLLLIPSDWQTALEWQYLVKNWRIASIGLGAVVLGSVLPAFLIAWPIAARVGYPIGKSILFVWQCIEGRSYAPFRMSLFVAFAGWVLLTSPGTGLLLPVLLGHLSAVLFDALVIVRHR